MKTQTYDEEIINAYLLGGLPDAEAERFDELSFTDDDFADALGVAEKNLIDEYVGGALSGARREQFETYFLASPLRREKVEFARAFQDFAAKNVEAQIAAASDEISSAAEAKPKKGWREFFSNLVSVPRLSLQWGFAAATLAFVFFGGWLFLENARLQRETDSAQTRQSELQKRAEELQNEIANQRAQDSEKEADLARVRDEIARLEQTREDERRRAAELERERDRLAKQRQVNAPPKSSAPPQSPMSIASFILTPQMRGDDQVPALPIPEKTDAVSVRLELEPNDYAAFRVRLVSRSDGRVRWRSGTIKAKSAGENKSLNVRFPAGLLKSPGIYSLEVSGGAGEIIGNYFFRPVIK
jgi:hypothetical protein